MTNQQENEIHSPSKSIILHLAPGILIGAFYFLVREPLDTAGYPSLMALISAIIVVLIPVELGYLLYAGKKKNGRFSLQGVVLYQTSIPTWQYFLWGFLLVAVMGLIFTLMKPVDAFLQQNFYNWVPLFESGLEAGYSRAALIRTYSMLAIFGVVVAPTVEELYFRGFLLPRMGYAGKWAPLLHSFLFALYHLWTPWMFITRTVAMLPLIFAVQRRNLNVGIIAHIAVNLMDVVMGFIFIANIA